MALAVLRRDENVPGDFFVDSTCIDCDLCRQIAPETFSEAGEMSAVHRQPATPDAELRAMKALVSCPTASIGASGNHPAAKAVASYPEQVDENVYFCGFAAESSFGASSYLIVRTEGNVLVDSPRYARPLARNIERLGGIRSIFLTHKDDVADQAKWSTEFGADRIMHRDDLGRSVHGVEHVVTGRSPMSLASDLTLIPTPGHTRGHMVLLYNKFLFSGDHLWWSERRQGLAASRNVCWYSWDEQIKSVEALLNYEFEWVLPGHGRRIQLKPAKMRSELHRCLDRMRKMSGRAVS